MIYNYLILIIIIGLLTYNLLSTTKFKTLESYDNPTTTKFQLNNEETITDTPIKHLSDLTEKTPLIKEFCSKLSYINNNHNEGSRQLLRFNNLVMKKLNLSKKTVNKYIQEIIDIQKNIYNDDNDINYRRNYENKLNKKVEKQLTVIDKAIENITNNLSGEIKLNIK